MSYVLIFLGGLTSSLHCIGMCGGFPVALAGSGDPKNLQRQLLYNFGRLNTLIFIGAVSGAAGAVLVASGPANSIERVLAVTMGAFMILVGFELLGVLSQVTGRIGRVAQAIVATWLSDVMRSQSIAAPIALGVFNAFLPCQLIYAFAAQAASTASITEGMLTMLFFGLGTIPAMLSLGLARILHRPLLRQRLSAFSAWLVISFGVITILRGFDLAPHLGHHHDGHHGHIGHSMP